MPSVSQAVLLSWSVPPAASFALALTALIYLRGWFLLRRAGVPFVPGWRAISFQLGLLTLWAALASPLDTFSGFLITAHMLQHMLLMMVAPPLLLLGAPLIPLVRGLPVFARREFAGPFLNWRLAQRVGAALTNLWVALILMGVAMFAWHTPRLYELALASSSWHEFEHACFFFASLIFWWPVVQPWPSPTRAPRWAAVPYLLVADLQNTILSAILVFSDRVLYPSYAKMPRLFGLSAMQDQAASGAIMWVVGSMAFIVPAVMIAFQSLSGSSSSMQLVRSIIEQECGPELFSSSRSQARRLIRGHLMEAVVFAALFAAAGFSLALLASRPSDDDDQALRMTKTMGAFEASMFAVPELVKGSNSIAVLVQDSVTHDVQLGVAVELRARQPNGGEQTMPIRASAEESDNKLLRSAEVDFSGVGDWLLSVAVRRGSESAEFTLPLQVAPPEHGSAVPWSYVWLLTLAAILCFAYIRRHRQEPIPPDAIFARAPETGRDLELTGRDR